MSSLSPPATATTTAATTTMHQTQTISDRFKSREEQAARASGQLPPEVDVKTGSMINPHNPEFITKRPWYLGGNDEGPSLDHQATQKDESERLELSLKEADRLVQLERQKLKVAKREQKFKVGMWVEALKRNKRPFSICQVVKIAKKGTMFDLKFEDGSIETNIVTKKQDRGKRNARIRVTKAGNRSFHVDHGKHGKETYDSKRDKYHGFEIHDHLQNLEQRYQERDAIRKKIKSRKEKDDNEDETQDKKDSNNEKQQEQQHASDSDSDYDSDAGSDSDDEFVQKDADAKVHVSRHARQGGVGGQQMKVTARNLRIREDTAKYLRNLDPNSAYYDPKSRSMRDNPNPEMDPSEATFAGDNFSRISGDAIGLAQTQVFAWDMEKAAGGSSGGGGGGAGTTTTTAAAAIAATMHPQANPSLAETLKKQFTNKEEDLKTKRKKTVLAKYGGAEYLDGNEGLGTEESKTDTTMAREAQKRKARFGVTVREEHYSRDGKTKSNTISKLINQKSKYEEDIFINGHNTVWGSYFHKGAFRWGYEDDHSLMKNSYCTGAAGRQANDESNELRFGTGIAGSAALAQANEILKTMLPNKKSSSNSNGRPTNSQMYGEADQFAKMDSKKLKEALDKTNDAEEKAVRSGGSSKRKYNSLNVDIDVSVEEMEAYRMTRERADDPLSKLSSDEILEYSK